MSTISGDAGSKSKTIFAAVLIIIIIAAVSFAVWYVFFRDELSARERILIHFKCKKCGHEFQMLNKELNDQILKAADPDGNYEYRQNAHCPECGAQWSGELMLECKKCGKHFVPKSEENPVCSFCGTNFFESMRGYDPESENEGPQPGENVGRPGRRPR